MKCLAVPLMLIASIATGSNTYAQATSTEVSVPFTQGSIGTIGTNANKSNNVSLFSTLGLQSVAFSQPSTTGQFGGTQGNDLSGTLSFVTQGGQTIDIPGAINWRKTTQGTLRSFGFIPDTNNPVVTISTPSGPFTLDGTRNYSMLKIGESLTYTDGDNIAGNAADSQTITSLNTYLAQISADAPTITGPSGNVGDTTITMDHPDGTTDVGIFSADTGVTWAIDGGVDSAFFSIDPASGLLVFDTAPDFLAPADNDTDNVYEVRIIATDSAGRFEAQTALITIISTPAPDISAEKTIVLVSETDVDCATTTIDPAASGFVPGACIEYIVTVSSADNGAETVSDMVVVDNIPDTLTPLSVTAQNNVASANLSGSTATANISPLPPGGSAVFSIRATLD